MKKSATKPRSRKARPLSEPPPPVSRQMDLPGPWVSTRRTLREFVFQAGYQALADLLEEGRLALCGPKHQCQPERTCYRYGYDQGQLVYGRRKIRVPRPRVRRADGSGEVELPSWKPFAESDPFAHRVQEQVLVGVSTHNYARSLEPLDAGLEARVTSQSAVSRRLIQAATRGLQAILERPLDGMDLPVLMIDGIGLGDHLVLVVLGMDQAGRKHFLGFREGTTENSEVCASLLADLIERGLPVERARLVVIDGGKGLRKAVRRIFGSWVLIQRCQVHKLRNVLEHLPEGRKPWFRQAIRKAWRLTDAGAAEKRLIALAQQLEEDHPGAASSLREGLAETVTILRLGLSNALYKTLCSTNPIENLQGSIRRITRNVKRWRSGKMVVRWVGMALVEAEQKFRRIRGYRDMPILLKSLDSQLTTSAMDKMENVA